MKEERRPHTRSPFVGRDCGWQRGEASEPRRRAQPQGCRGQSGEIPAQRLGAEQHSPAREACLLSRRGGRGLGAEARASVLAGRESGKKSAAAEEAGDFFLPLCFAARKEMGFRALPKRTPEMGASRGYQRGSHSNRGAEGKTERFPHRGSVPSSTHQAERLVCSPAGAGGGWEPRLGLRSDRRERTGAGSVNTA